MSNFAFLLVVFKQHYGSEGVKRGCTSGGVYVPCIYLHASRELP